MPKVQCTALPVCSSQRWAVRTPTPSRTSGSGELEWQHAPTGLWPARSKWTRQHCWVLCITVVGKSRNVSQVSHVWNHGGFALSPCERVHLLVFGILSFSLCEEEKNLFTHCQHIFIFIFRIHTFWRGILIGPISICNECRLTTRAFSDSTMFQLLFLWLM